MIGKNWHERVNISQEWRANLSDRLCGTPSYHAKANSRGWLKDSIALGNCEQFTAKGQCNREGRATRNRPLRVRDGLGAWGA